MAETHHFNTSSLFSVRDHVCLVTGGGTGIGLMATQALAANGAKVYITSRRTEALENAAKTHEPSNGGSIVPIGPCDVRKKADLERLVKDLRDKGETRLDLVVCAAGVSGTKADPAGEEDAAELSRKLWEEEDVESWQQTYETNVTSVYFTVVALLPLLQASIKEKKREQFQPSVITISSMSGQMRHAQGHFSYNTSKGGAAHLAKLMSAEFRHTGVRVNSIAPGYFPSEMTAKEDSNEKQKSHLPDEKVAEKGHVPAMRPGRDEEMGMTVLFLAKNAYVNGQILTVDGGVLNVVSS